MGQGKRAVGQGLDSRQGKRAVGQGKRAVGQGLDSRQGKRAVGQGLGFRV